MKGVHLLVAGLILQLAVLAGTVAQAVYPLITGREIELRIQPRDPRDLFMGQYVDLAYGFNNILFSEIFPKPERIRTGEAIYVSLERRGAVWEKRAVSLTPPRDGVFIRGTAAEPYDPARFPYSNTLAVRYGIERFYAAPRTARELEASVRRRISRVRVAVAPDGRAAIVKVLSDAEGTPE